MKSSVIKKGSVILTLFLLSVTLLQGQNRSEIIKVYNEGVKTIPTDIQAAIGDFEQVVKMSEQVGDSALDLKQNAIQALPGLYLKSAQTALTAKKPAPEVVKAAKNAVTGTNKYGSDANKETAKKLLASAYNYMAVDYFNKNDLNNALNSFDSVLQANPDFVSAIFNKALIYRKQDNAQAFEQTIDSYLEKVKNDQQKTKQANDLALEYFRAEGSKANQANELDKALELLSKAAKYGEDKNVYYYFSDVYNKQKKYDNAEENARKGLGLETGDAEAKAKFYWQLGLAQKGKGQNTEACESLKNAMYGAFAGPAKAERTNLKCQ